jgi:hypothetical protein
MDQAEDPIDQLKDPTDQSKDQTDATKDPMDQIKDNVRQEMNLKEDKEEEKTKNTRGEGGFKHHVAQAKSNPLMYSFLFLLTVGGQWECGRPSDNMKSGNARYMGQNAAVMQYLKGS